MTPDLATTNRILAIMAAVSVLEALLIIGIAVGAFMAYWRVMRVVNELEAKHVQPVMARVNDMLDDLKRVTATVKEETDRVDHAIHSTVDRLDATAQRVRSNVRVKTSRLVGFVRGVRAALETLFEDRPTRGDYGEARG